MKAELDNSTIIRIEATSLGGEERVASSIPSFKEVTDAVEGIVHAMVTTLKKVKPQQASVEFGLEIGVESGKLTTLLILSLKELQPHFLVKDGLVCSPIAERHRRGANMQWL